MPLIHKLNEIFKSVYALAPRLSKRNRYGIYLKLESATLDALQLSLAAALSPRGEKAQALSQLALKVELAKQLVRIAREIGAVDERQYIAIAVGLVEASKMTAGWLKYVNANPAGGRE